MQNQIGSTAPLFAYPMMERGAGRLCSWAMGDLCARARTLARHWYFLENLANYTSQQIQ
jgi:hypothetical protein